MGVEIDGSVAGGAVVSAAAVTTALEQLTSTGTFAGQVVAPFPSTGLVQQGPIDRKLNY